MKLSSSYNLEIQFPDLAREWHPIKNGNPIPSDFTPGSKEKVWWKCLRGHEWEAIVKSRTGQSKTGCPFCSGKKACSDNCLETLFPDIAKEWHPFKNGNLTPKDVTRGCKNKVWWICSKGHEWEAAVYNRTGGNKTGCPCCTGQKACSDNCFETLFPDLAQEWHPTKNGNLTPYDVTKACSNKVWWVCSKGHEWKAFIYSRTGNVKSGCPKCYTLSQIGTGNPAWKGGLSFEPYSPEFNKKLKLAIRTRDNFTCQLCWIKEEEHIKKYHRVLCPHHIDYVKKNCSPQNLITLCNRCNIKVNKDREYWTGYFQERTLTMGG